MAFSVYHVYNRVKVYLRISSAEMDEMNHKIVMRSFELFWKETILLTDCVFVKELRPTTAVFCFPLLTLILKDFPSPSNSFYLNPVMIIEVLNVVNSLKLSSCCDYYGTNAEIIILVMDVIIDPLSSLYNP